MPKKYQVIKATTRETPGVTVGGRPKYFGTNGTFETSDPGEAKEIDKVLGAKGTGEVVVTSYDQKEPGHNYRFTGVDTSHMVRPKPGDKKSINGVVYQYVEYGGKLRLVPAKYMKQKRRKRASVRREVSND